MPAPTKGFRLELKPRPNGFYYYRGPHIQPTTTGEKERGKAETWFAQFRLDMENPAGKKPDGVTIGQCFAIYDENQIELHIKTKEKLRRNILQTCGFFGMETIVNLENLNQLRINDFWRWRRAQPNGMGGFIKDGVIRQELFNFKAVLNYAVGANILDSRLIPQKIAYPPASQSRKRVLTVLELETIFEAARHMQGGKNRLPVMYLLCVILAATGRRRRTVEQLAWSQVKWEAGVIVFLPDGDIESTKEQGAVPISDFLRPILEQAYRERQTPYVMGNPMPQRGSTFRRMCDRLGFHDVVPHTLRHTFGSWLAYKGYSIAQIAHAMDCTEDTAREHYVHFTDQQKRETVNNVIPLDIKAHTQRNPLIPLKRPSTKAKAKGGKAG